MSSPTAIGVDLHLHHLQAVVIAADGEVLGRARRDLGADPTGEGLAEAVAAVAGELSEGLPVGVAVPCAVDRSSGGLRGCSGFAWDGLDVGPHLADRLGVELVVEERLRCAAASEGVEDLLWVQLDDTLGLAAVTGGEVLRGGHAEHLVLYPGGRKCGCGQRGCLAAYASGGALVDTVREAFWEEGRKGGCPVKRPQDAFDLEGERGDRPDPDFWVTRGLERWALDLALGVASLAHVLAPTAIVADGALCTWWERLAPSLEVGVRRKVSAELARALPVRRPAAGEDAAAVGAAKLALG